MTPVEYCIRVKGYLPPGWSELLEGMEVQQEPGGNTLLSGFVKDQAALYGLINKLQSIGVTLISINPMVEPKILSSGSESNREE